MDDELFYYDDNDDESDGNGEADGDNNNNSNDEKGKDGCRPDSLPDICPPDIFLPEIGPPGHIPPWIYCPPDIFTPPYIRLIIYVVFENSWG